MAAKTDTVSLVSADPNHVLVQVKPSGGLALLREPFPAHQISKLPKPTKQQTEDVKADFKKGIRCALCGAWHHPKVEHLDYVGHAALTDRLLDADPAWDWQPLAFDADGMPKFDKHGGLWIRLTVCGQSRLGYGNASNRDGADGVKEAIGDALRNAAMRFGAALDLWHKGQLHLEETPAEEEPIVDDDAYAAWLVTLETTATEAGYDALLVDIKQATEAWQARLRKDKTAWTHLKNPTTRHAEPAHA